MARFRPSSATTANVADVDWRAEGRILTATEPDPPSTSNPCRNRSAILTVVAVVLLAGAAALRRHDLVASLEVLVDLAPIPFIVAIALSVAAMANRAGQFRSAHRLAGIDTDLRSMARISAAGYALNKIVKTGGIGGVALFVRHGRRRGLPPGSVLAACLVSSLSSQVAMLSMVGLAVVALVVSTSAIGPTAAIAAVVALVILIGLPAAGAVCFRSRSLVERWYQVPFRVASRVASRFGRTSPAPPDPANLDHFYDTIAALRHNPMVSLPILAHAMAAKLLGAAVLTAVLLAVGAEIGPGTALLVYVLALVAAASTLLPGGLGAVEATMTLLLAGQGVPTATALAGTIAFRLLDLWLPILVGLLATPGLDRSTERTRARHVARARRLARADAPLVAVSEPAKPDRSALAWLNSMAARSPVSAGHCTTTACWCPGPSPCRALAATP